MVFHLFHKISLLECLLSSNFKDDLNAPLIYPTKPYNPRTEQIGIFNLLNLNEEIIVEIWSILEDELVRYRDVVSHIQLLLMRYEKDCISLIAEISQKTFDDSQCIFDELYNIQEKLAIAMHKYEFNLNERLNNFVYYFDRDDLVSRKYWYKKFSEGLKWPEE
jgi:hypothetical protein